MLTQLPEYIEPIRLAASRQVISGKIALSKMGRLVTLLQNAKQEAVVKLTFGRDETGQVTVAGYVKAQFKLICQRCMQPMNYPVNAIVNLGLVASDAESKQLPINVEPFIVDEPKISLTTLIEDELLLELPVAAMHPLDECEASDLYQCVSQVNAEQTAKKSQNIEHNVVTADTQKHRPTNESKINSQSNPFALLSDLKIKLK